MGSIIAVANQKGGVGKTTTTINLGAALAEKGYRVLWVDLDPQAALTNGVGFQPDDLARTVYNVLVEAEPRTADAILPVRLGIDLLPANIDLAAAEIELVSALSRESLLKDALQPLAAGYDFVLIDCGPNLGLLTIRCFDCRGRGADSAAM